MNLTSYFSSRYLRTRISLVVLGVVLLTTFSILFFQQRALINSITMAQEESSLNLVNTVSLFVESEYRSITFHKQASLEKREAMLRSVLHLAFIQVELMYEKYRSGEMSETEAKKAAIESIELMRYDNDVGYLWINTTDRPIPRMIMHATMEYLDGEILDDPMFNCALGRGENLFKAMVDVCMDSGKGYVDYLWPKPTPDGLSERVPKLSYVELFEPWGWVIGTGLYVDDIENDANERLHVVLEELRNSFANIKVAQTGYMFLFTGDQQMLVHPYLVGEDMTKLLSPETGNPILEDLIQTVNNSQQKLTYTWDKPPEHAGDFRFKKTAFVNRIEPLDWYIASSVYNDETEKTATEVRWRVILLGLILLAVAFVLSVLLARSLARPLGELSKAAKEIDIEGGLKERVPVGGTEETRELGLVLNSMLGSLQEEITERRQAEATLTRALQEKELLLREVHHRVKNNMAVVSSMLNMQAKRVSDPEVRQALEESRSRISAMSLIHETLYRSNNLAEIPLKEYIEEIFHALLQAMMRIKGGVRLEIVGDPVTLTVEQAVPGGLVLNELITNSLKYGYPDGGPGVIRIATHLREDGWIDLTYSDDGIGLPDDFSLDDQKTLGMRIIRLLVENQLDGRLDWKSGPGAMFEISWHIGEKR